MARDLLTLRG